MDITAQFTQCIDSDSNVSRSGGILLRGRTRHDRQPIHLILAVDTSGSMDMDNKLLIVKQSIQLLLHLLTPNDRISLVSFDDDAKTLLRHAIPSTEEKSTIEHRIQSLHTAGSTNMSAGLLEAATLIEAGDAPSNRKQGLLLLTDGHANMGIKDTSGLVQILNRILSDHPTLAIHSIGYGTDHNAELLTAMGSVGGGSYNVVNNAEDVATVLGEVSGGLMSLAAQRVVVEFPPEFTVRTSYPTEKRPDGTLLVKVGDVYSESDAVILFSGSPALGSPRITGTDMATLNPVNEILAIEHRIMPIHIGILVAELRQDVKEFLEDIRGRRGRKEDLTLRLNMLLDKMNGMEILRNHSLLPLLKEELESARALIDREQPLTQEENTYLAQHSAYVGLARGMRSMPPPAAASVSRVYYRRSAPTNSQEEEEEEELVSDPVAAGGAGTTTVPPNPFSSPFSNRIQRQTAAILRSLTSQTPQ